MLFNSQIYFHYLDFEVGVMMKAIGKYKLKEKGEILHFYFDMAQMFLDCFQN